MPISYKLGGELRGTKRTDTFYPNFRGGGTWSSVIRKLGRQFERKSVANNSPGGSGGGGRDNNPGVTSSGSTVLMSGAPWFPGSLAVPNSGTDTKNFGNVLAVKVVDMHYLASNSLGVQIGRVRLKHDGAGTAVLEDSDISPSDGFCGLTFSVAIVSDELILTCTSDGTGGDSVVNFVYSYRGLNTRVAHGTYSIDRSNGVTIDHQEGDFSVGQNGVVKFDAQSFIWDDVNISLAGSISGGALALTATDDLANGHDAVVTITYTYLGLDNTWQWAEQNLTVPNGSNASTSFLSPTTGLVDWTSDVFTISPNDSTDFVFSSLYGCVLGYFSAKRETGFEGGFFKVYNDAGFGDPIQFIESLTDPLYPTGISATTYQADGCCILTIAADGLDSNDTTFNLTFIGIDAIP